MVANTSRNKENVEKEQENVRNSQKSKQAYNNENI